MNDVVETEVLEELRNTEYFCLAVDESTDAAMTKHLAMYVKYRVDDSILCLKNAKLTSMKWRTHSKLEIDGGKYLAPLIFPLFLLLLLQTKQLIVTNVCYYWRTSWRYTIYSTYSHRYNSCRSIESYLNTNQLSLKNMAMFMSDGAEVICWANMRVCRL